MLSESIVACVVFFGSAYWFRKDDPRNASILAFAKDLATPALDSGHQDVMAGLRIYGLLGRICMVLGGILAACAFLPSTDVAPASLNLVAGIMLLTLGVVAWLGTRNRISAGESVS